MNCPHPPDADCFLWKNGIVFPELKAALESFLNDTAKSIARISNASSTQNVESANAEYAKALSKQLAWKYVQPRLDSVVLKHNEPQNALSVIAECCGDEPPSETIDYFRQEEEKKEKETRQEEQKKHGKRKTKRDGISEEETKEILKMGTK